MRSRKSGGAAPIETAKEPDGKHRLEPYFVEKKIFHQFVSN